MSQVIHLERRAKKRTVIIGNGMAGDKLVDELLARGCRDHIIVFGEERRGSYNRILLSKVLGGADPELITLKDMAWYGHRGVQLEAGVRVLRIDDHQQVVVTSDGREVPYDEVVVATGSRAFVPPVAGLRNDDTLLDGVFVFRTIDDCLAIRDAIPTSRRAVVVGGGLLGLEAAKGLADLGLPVTLVHGAAGLMNRQLDRSAGELLARSMEELGIEVLLDAKVTAVAGVGSVERALVDRKDGAGPVPLSCDLLVFACGIQPRLEVARASGLPVKRGIVVDDWMRVEGVEGISAVGECAEHAGQVYGVVAPIWDQVAVLAERLVTGESERFRPARIYTKLKAAGVAVASLGDVEGGPDDEVVVIQEPRRRAYRKLIIRDDRLIGAQFVGDTDAAPRVVQHWDRGLPVPANRLDLLCSDDIAPATAATDREICNCNRVGADAIIGAVESGCRSVAAVGDKTRAGTSCGSCRGDIERIIAQHGDDDDQAAAS